MRNLLVILTVLVISVSAYPNVNLFTDNFDRSVVQQNDIDATSAGMSGRASPMTYVERGDDVIASNAALTNIKNNQLHLADGTNATTLYLDHNFTESEILAAGGMKIGLTIVSNDGTTTDLNRFIGFGVGNTLTECQTASFDFNGVGFRGRMDNYAGTSDMWIGWSPVGGGTIQVFKNGPTSNGGENYDVATGVALTGNDQLELELYFGDFNAGTTCQATLLWNGSIIHTTTFQWDNTNQNYIGICARQNDQGYTADDLKIEAVTGDLSPSVSQLHADPGFMLANNTSASQMLSWSAAFLQTGSTYAVTADKAITFPNTEETGPAVNGNTSIEVITDGTLGDVAFTVTIYEGATPVASDSMVVNVIPEQNPETPNFIVILTDDQGWGTTSIQIDPNVPESKSDFFETPNLERLAECGIRFPQAYSSHPNCSPSRAALLLGRSPASLHFTDIVDRNSGPFYVGNPMIPATHINDLPTAELTIPELLKQHNPAYTAAHFGKWHLNGGGPANHGFDTSDGATGNGAGNTGSTTDPKQVFGIAQRGNDWMQSQVLQGKPFYLQLSHYATHLNIEYRPETKAYFDTKIPGIRHQDVGFAAMIFDLDEAIGRTLDKVFELGIQDNTYIIYTADNGTYPVDMPGNINGPIRGWKATVWEGGVRVPFIVVGPGIAGNTISREPVVGYDVLPTICEIAGINPANLPQVVEGGSFSHILHDSSGPVIRSRDGLVFHWPHYQNDKFSTPDSTLLLDGYKLHYRWETQKQQLFHLDQDLAETTDLARLDRTRANQMVQALHQRLNEIGALLPSPNPDYTAICWNPSDPTYPPNDFMGRDPSPYDLNGNCQVESGDLGLLVAEWLQSTPAYDFDGSSRVNLGDFAKIAEDWLGCWWIPVELNCL